MTLVEVQCTGRNMLVGKSHTMENACTTWHMLVLHVACTRIVPTQEL